MSILSQIEVLTLFTPEWENIVWTKIVFLAYGFPFKCGNFTSIVYCFSIGFFFLNRIPNPFVVHFWSSFCYLNKKFLELFQNLPCCDFLFQVGTSLDSKTAPGVVEYKQYFYCDLDGDAESLVLAIKVLKNCVIEFTFNDSSIFVQNENSCKLSLFV